jgi:hypothetical protein
MDRRHHWARRSLLHMSANFKIKIETCANEFDFNEWKTTI